MNTFGLIDSTGKIINLVKAVQESDISNPDNYTIIDLTSSPNVGTNEYWDNSNSTVVNPPVLTSLSTLPSTGSTTVNVHLAYDRNINALGTLEISMKGETLTEWSITNQTLTDSGSIFDVTKTLDPSPSGGVDIDIIPESITDSEGRIYSVGNGYGVKLIHNFSLD